MNSRYLNISQLAYLLNADRRTIRNKLASVKPFEKQGKALVYDASTILGIKSDLDDASTSALDKKIKEASLRSELAKADKTELEVARIRGEQVPIDDVAQIVEREYSAVRSQLIAIPTKMCLELSTVDDPAIIQNKLQDAINECLTELSADENFKNNIVPDLGEDDEHTIDSSLEEGGGELAETKT